MKKRHVSLFVGILFIFFFTPASRVFAYSVETHAFLTDVVFDFYNQYSSSNKIPEKFRSFFIDGSRREDDAPRWMNHFFDPVHNRGFSDSILGTWQVSKEWAVDEENQNKATYKVPATVASILTAIQQRSIEMISAETNFTWQQAIRYWLKGEEEKAIFMLGHVVHLIEDVTVPEHTRNDSHPGDSPYENWTAQFIPNAPDVTLRSRLGDGYSASFNDLGSVFVQLATFTNNGFYSKDTLGITRTYKLPESSYFSTLEDGRSYGMKEDRDFGDYPLIKAQGLLESEDKELLNRPIIMSAYWSRLSTKAVQYSAGVIGLFFKDVERAKIDPNFLGEEPESFVANALDTVQGFIVSAGSAVESAVGGIAKFTKNIISRITNEPENLVEILTESVEQIESLLAGDLTDGIVIDTDEERGQLKELQNQLDDISDQIDDLTYQVGDVAKGEGKGGIQNEAFGLEKEEANVTDTAGKSSQLNFVSSGGGGVAVSVPNLVITEIMYNASGTDDGHEWIEIRNNGASSVSFDDVKFLEGGTNHRLSSMRGSASLTVGGYAVIADDADQFLIDFPLFSGNLFDSSFSLSNDGEALPLAFNGSSFYSVAYASSTGAYGDGNSLQLTGAGWVAAVPTPGVANVAVTISTGGSTGDTSTSTVTSSPPTSGFGASHVVISEVQVDGVDAGDEFIELYNPTDAAVDLSGWSLQYVSGAVETVTSSTVSKKNFLATSFIAAKGFYLIGRGFNAAGEDGYQGYVEPNMTHRTFSLSGVSAGARIFLVPSATFIESETDPNILDVLDYTSTTIPDAGSSFERRAWSNNLCHSVIPNGSGEFLGNGCDAGVFADDFELRSISRPQNSGSFVEPRAAPSALQVPTGALALAEYVRDSVSINFAWEPSADFQGVTSTMVYRITNASTSAAIFNAISTSFSQRVTEVGRSHSFVLQAFDRDGMGSATTSVTVDAPSFVNSLYLYPDPFATSSRYAVDLYYDSYPFIPHRWSSGDTSRVAVFYLNRVPSTERDFVTSGGAEVPVAMREGLLAMKFRDCGGQPDQISSLPILPDSSGNCEGAGPNVDDVSFLLLEDPHVRFTLASPSDTLALSAADYLTLAFYDYSSPTWACTCRMFSIVAIDANRYYFSSTAPPFAAPILPDTLQVEFKPTQSRLITRWEAATDRDTLDNLLAYEINFSTSTALDETRWESAGAQPSANLDNQTFISHRFLRHVTPGDPFTVGVRAKDEFNVTSTSRMVMWPYPAVAEVFSQATSTGWSVQWGDKNPNRTDSSVASLQSVTPATTIIFDVASVRVWEDQTRRGALATLRLGVYGDDGESRPLLSLKIGEATVEKKGETPTATDIAFTFSNPVTLDAGTKYWLVLDVGSYDNGMAYYDNRWRNAISVGNDAYPAGQAGKGSATLCTDMDFCKVEVPAPAGTPDWYLKLYLRQ
ncbi:MAG: lamin tail domain-containing protein [Candidatus Brennerbacteria bacterium]